MARSQLCRPAVDAGGKGGGAGGRSGGRGRSGSVVTQRHGIWNSLLHNWRSAKAVVWQSEPEPSCQRNSFSLVASPTPRGVWRGGPVTP